jgi:hypothetical protein
MIRDIRDVSDEQYWEELRRKWGALLSYRYIGRQFSSMNNVDDATVALRRDMRNASHGIMAAPLVIMCPGAGGKSDLEAVPNPVIHSLQILDAARDVSRAEIIDMESLKQGRTMTFGRARIVDAANHSRVIALVESQGASIGDVPEGLAKFDDDTVMEIDDTPDLPPLWKVFGGLRRNDGHWVIPEFKEELASPDAALHIGPQHVLLETAAIELAEESAGTDMLQIESWHVMHIARGKIGPFRVDGVAIPGSPGSGRVGVQLTLLDEGNADRVITSASTVFRVEPD